MPRYYFDSADGDKSIRDDEGFEFDTLEAARRAAIAALPDLARDDLPDGDRRVFIIRMRDENGRHLLHASLSLVADWMG